MREIKFRVWFPPKYGSKGIMRDVKSIDFIFGRVADMSNHGKYIDKDNLTLMQCTGLKDINGVEIYEGDVIKEQVDNDEYIYVEVVFEEGVFMGKETRFEPEYPIHDYLNGWVVGNIKENPELMEVD